MLNDAGEDEYDNQIEDEDGSIYPTPATEIGTLELAIDRGSGSYAEDGRLEVAEDQEMNDGEMQIGGSGNIAVDGPTEIGRGFHEDDDFEGTDRNYDSDVGAAEAADRIASELGAAEAADRPGSELGAASAADRLATEIGLDSSVMAPFESFMLDDTRIGDHFSIDAVGDEVGDEVGSAAMYGPTEIGADDEDDDFEGVDRNYYSDVGAAEAADRPGTEIGVGSPAAVLKVIEKARDNRQPAPPMRALDVDAPMRDVEDDWGLTDVVLGAAAATGADPFPLTSKLLLRAGAGMEPRYVRVDTEESYKQFRTQNSPELAELSARFEAHIADPHAHGGGESSDLANLSDDIDDLVHLGAEVDAAEAAKRVELWMPRRFDGMVTAWREGDFVCASMTLPGSDGEVRICTSLEPVRKCVAEMARHAAESGVPAATVVGVIPQMGCVLGAATALKEMAAAAPSILSRPEARGKASFEVRIEPKTSPALAALAMLVSMCRAGDAQACEEWRRLGDLSAGPVKQAMLEAVQIVKAA